MIEITSLASGSSGNCYKIDDGSSSLLIEAGIPIKKIKEKLDYRLSEVGGCLVSHEHGDHSKAVEDIMSAGIDCYMSLGTKEALKLNNHRVNEIITKSADITRSRPEIGSWILRGFEVEHDAEEPLGFLFWSKATKDKLVYLTDTFYSKYKFHELDYIMVECNYSKEILDENIAAGRVPAVQKKRLLKTHMSLETCKDFLRANDLSRVKEIWLLHLSDRNSNEERFKRKIQGLTGKPVFIA